MSYEEAECSGPERAASPSDCPAPEPFDLAEFSVSVRTAATMLGLDPRVVCRLVRNGTLRHVSVGQKRYVPLPELFAYRRLLRSWADDGEGRAD